MCRNICYHTINKYVLADALVNQKSCIRIIDYIDKLKYLLFFDFTKEEIENIRKKIGFKKIVNFQRIHKKEN